MESLVNLILSSLKGVAPKEAIVFIISLLPILELRGGLLAASFLKIPYIKAAIICIVGNLLPIPFILLLLEKVLLIMEKISFTKGIALWLKEKAAKNKEAIDKYGFWGLVLFVGIPLPGTGAWTGSLVATVFHMNRWKSFLAILLGVFMAFVIMSIISYGVIYNIIK